MPVARQRALRTWGERLGSPYLLLTLTPLAWAGNIVAGRGARELIAPIDLSFFRWSIALIVLLPLMAPALWRHRHILRARWRYLALMGLLGMAGFHSLVYVAVTHTTALNAALFLSTVPFLIVVVAWALHGTRVSLTQVLALLVSLVGAMVVIMRGDLRTLVELRFNPGDLLMAFAAMVWAVYSVLLQARPKEVPSMALLCAFIFFGVLWLIPIWLMTTEGVGRYSLSAELVSLLLYVSVIASIIANGFWNIGVAKVGPSTAGIFMQLMPVFAALLAIIFLGERLAFYHLIGIVCVATGVWLFARRRAA